MPRTRRVLLPLLSLLLSTALVGLLAGCSDVEGTGDKGYVDGKGVISQLPAGHRRSVGTVEGSTLDGKHVSLSDYAGKVVVVNVWGAWCPPCRAEARRLGDLARQLEPQGVVFLGINTRDASREQGKAFERTYDISYPSIYDPDGQTLLAFRGTITPSSIPSTLVIDKQGRVAASILGEVTSATTLKDIVQDVAG
jgi:thiol-disulfide isomerase/thioredoxin